LEIPGGYSDNLKERFSRLMEVLERIVPLLKHLHHLDKAHVDISLLGEERLTNGEIKEETFFEDVALDATSLDALNQAFKLVVQPYPRSLVTRVNVDLNTRVLEEMGESVFPKSAELYMGTDSYAQADQEANLYVSYSTFIDVWLPKTFGPDRVLRDNTEPSNRNHPHLRAFLQGLENAFVASLAAGESYYYFESLQRTGFVY